jgi:hypothetical protein
MQNIKCSYGELNKNSNLEGYGRLTQGIKSKHFEVKTNLHAQENTTVLRFTFCIYTFQAQKQKHKLANDSLCCNVETDERIISA